MPIIENKQRVRKEDHFPSTYQGNDLKLKLEKKIEEKERILIIEKKIIREIKLYIFNMVYNS